MMWMLRKQPMSSFLARNCDMVSDGQAVLTMYVGLVVLKGCCSWTARLLEMSF